MIIWPLEDTGWAFSRYAVKFSSLQSISGSAGSSGLCERGDCPGAWTAAAATIPHTGHPGLDGKAIKYEDKLTQSNLNEQRFLTEWQMVNYVNEYALASLVPILRNSISLYLFKLRTASAWRKKPLSRPRYTFKIVRQYDSCRQSVVFRRHEIRRSGDRQWYGNVAMWLPYYCDIYWKITEIRIPPLTELNLVFKVVDRPQAPHLIVTLSKWEPIEKVSSKHLMSSDKK